MADLCLKGMPKLTVISSTPKKQVHVENFATMRSSNFFYV